MLKPGFTGASIKSADYARDIIATMERETKSKPARKRMARMVVDRGNYDESGKQVWRDYLATFN